MRSHVTREFRERFSVLPHEIQGQARRSYSVWTENPRHPGLQFKKVHTKLPIYSVRVGLGWRAVGVIDADGIVWFWIGGHDDYDSLLKRL